MKYATLYLISLSLFSCIVFFMPEIFIKRIFVILLSIMAVLPVVLIVSQIKKKSSLIVAILSFGITLFLFGLFFRKVRDSLSPPSISDTKIIGYTHYFGYPFYLDTIVFFFFVFFPILVFVLFYFLQKLYKKLKSI